MARVEPDRQEPLTSHCIVAGKNFGQSTLREVTSPYSGSLVSRVADANAAAIEQAVEAGRMGARAMAEMPARIRRELLLATAFNLKNQASEIARTLCLETGKAIRDCMVELGRAAEVVELCAEESVRISGRHIPLEASKAGQGKMAFSARFPVGLVAGIVPFNAPVNLSCHKSGPALAAGNAIIIKAPPQAPMTTELVVRTFLDAGFPPESVGLLHGGGEVGSGLVSDPRVDFLSFTGSHAAGLAIKQVAGTRGCTLELGGLGPTIVHRDADIEKAAATITVAGFRLAGQSCASVQNLFVHEDVHEAFERLFLKRIAALTVGDPLDPETDFGPVIDSRSADRIMETIRMAIAAGAGCLTGGTRDGQMIAPTVLTNVSPQMKAVCEEIFGPVIVLRPYRNLDETIDWIVSSQSGINCGLFTDSNAVIQQAFRRITCGALIINGTSTFRPDQLPYGGWGKSGYGREAPFETIRAMTQERILVLS